MHLVYTIMLIPAVNKYPPADLPCLVECGLPSDALLVRSEPVTVGNSPPMSDKLISLRLLVRLVTAGVPTPAIGLGFTTYNARLDKFYR